LKPTEGIPKQIIAVFIDPRFELYPMEQLNDYRYLNAGCNVEELLAKHRIDGLLLDPKSQKELAKRELASGRWREVFRDASTLVMVPARAATHR
jgi:hypothetical protein